MGELAEELLDDKGGVAIVAIVGERTSSSSWFGIKRVNGLSRAAKPRPEDVGPLSSNYTSALSNLRSIALSGVGDRQFPCITTPP